MTGALPQLTPGALALPIEILGSLYLAGAAGRAVLRLAWGPSPGRPEAARLIIADGVITSLSFKAAAALLKILTVQTWNQIAMFASILALRTVLKRFFSWEAAQLRRELGAVSQPERR